MDTFLITLACVCAYGAVIYLIVLGLWALCTKTP